MNMSRISSTLIGISIVILFSNASVYSNSSTVSTTTRLGNIVGKVSTSLQGRSFYAFLGIKYGKAPVGNLRFKQSSLVGGWIGTLNATKSGPDCPKIDRSTMKYAGEEDCLYLNVYTPTVYVLSLLHIQRKKLPVIIFVIGGRFREESMSYDTWEAEPLMDRDVVVVTSNYRTNIMGLFSTGDDASPGNFMLLDQNLVFQWVQHYIEDFGGDKNRVQIIGHSSSAASAFLHLFSPLSKGLFHTAIMQSGFQSCNWNTNESPFDLAMKTAQRLNCTTESSKEMVECLRRIPADVLVQATDKLPYYFVIDGNIVRASPASAMSKKWMMKVPVIIGVTSHEGGFLYAEAVHLGNISPFTPSNFDTASCQLLNNEIHLYHPCDQKGFDDIKLEYFQNISSSTSIKELRGTMIEAMSDYYFKSCSDAVAHALVSSGITLYTYVFAHESNNSFAKLLFNFDENLGAVHTDELLYLFNYTHNIHLSSDDVKVSNIFTSLWTNFAAYGNPTPSNSSLDFTWKKYHLNNPQHLQIDVHPKMVDGDFSSHTEFWLKRGSTNINNMSVLLPYSGFP